MKPLSEQALKEAVLTILRYPNGKRPPRNSIAEEIRHGQAEKLVNLILSDRKAWGEYVIGTSSLSMVMSPAIRLKNGHIDTSWTDEHDKYKAAYIEDGLRAEQRQRNQEGNSK